ncbi:ribosome-associated translation inhibitor RaiA [bacterium]|nr:ribosome-associated translation inhibitor RaiA [bacterium]
MKITITSRRMEITQPLRDYIDSKVKKISKFKRNITEAHVILSVEKYRQIAEISLSGNGFSLSSTEETADMYSSIDGAIEKLERQAKKLKTKKIDHKRSGHSRNPDNPKTWNPEEADENAKRHIVKIDAFIAKPMSIDEAALQLEYREDEILMFRNAQSNEINVVYRRADGSVGLLEPE